MRSPVLLLVACLLCTPLLAAASPAEEAKAAVIAADKAFAAMAAKDGILNAFQAYCTDSTKFLGSRTLKGHAAVTAMFAGLPAGATLTWSPDAADASSSGDLAFTYGRYAYSQPSQGGPPLTSTGTYVTIWRRQADGSWKFILDGGPSDPKPRT